jgi:DNA-binding transcriptional MerR regulator
MTNLLTERQAAERIAIPVSTLRYWRSAGEGPNFFKFGKYVRYSEGALEEYLQRALRVSSARATVEEVFNRVAH